MRALPFSESSERNKLPILQVLSAHLRPGLSFLDFSCGTGQHSEYFSEQFPDVDFYSSEVEENLWMNTQRSQALGRGNYHPPLKWELGGETLPPFEHSFDVVFTANTFHIMPESCMGELASRLPDLLGPQGLFILYGPFLYDGEFIGEGNKRFDALLRERSELMGLREFTNIEKLLSKHQMELLESHDLPANNQIHIFKRMAP